MELGDCRLAFSKTIVQGEHQILVAGLLRRVADCHESRCTRATVDSAGGRLSELEEEWPAFAGALMASASALAVSLEEGVRLDVEGGGELADRVDGGAVLAAFEQAHIGAVNVGAVGEFLLGESPQAAIVPEICGEGFADIHPGDWMVLRSIRPRSILLERVEGGLFEKGGRGGVERAGEFLDHVQRGAVLASFQKADIGPVDVCETGKILLRQAPSLPDPLEVEGEGLPERHPGRKAPCRVYSHGVYSEYSCCFGRCVQVVSEDG